MPTLADELTGLVSALHGTCSDGFCLVLAEGAVYESGQTKSMTGQVNKAPGMTTRESEVLTDQATLDAADSTMIAGTDQTGLLRYNGRQELAAIDALEGDTLDPSATLPCPAASLTASRKISTR